MDSDCLVISDQLDQPTYSQDSADSRRSSTSRNSRRPSISTNSQRPSISPNSRRPSISPNSRRPSISTNSRRPSISTNAGIGMDRLSSKIAPAEEMCSRCTDGLSKQTSRKDTDIIEGQASNVRRETVDRLSRQTSKCAEEPSRNLSKKGSMAIPISLHQIPEERVATLEALQKAMSFIQETTGDIVLPLPQKQLSEDSEDMQAELEQMLPVVDRVAENGTSSESINSESSQSWTIVQPELTQDENDAQVWLHLLKAIEQMRLLKLFLLFCLASTRTGVPGAAQVMKR